MVRLFLGKLKDEAVRHAATARALPYLGQEYTDTAVRQTAMALAWP